MKYSDKVRLISDKYENEGLKKGMIGTILEAGIFWNEFTVNFEDQRFYDKNFKFNDENMYTIQDDIYTHIKIEDLELYEEGNYTDEDVKRDLPEEHKDWWCKVEDGFIMNADGKKKNKIPYDYDS